MTVRAIATTVITSALVLGAVAACSNDDDPGNGLELDGEIDLTVDDEHGCDFLDEKQCLFPFPTDHYTTDADTATGKQVDFQLEAMPANVDGVHIDPTEWNRNDGFSVGSPVITFVPGLDLEATGATPITDMATALERGAPIVLLDAETGDRYPYWAELDANVEPEADRSLLIHPARNFLEGRRYLVALRDLKDAEGRTIEPSPAFRAYRDRLGTDDPAVEARRDHMEALFATLEDAGIGREELYLAWDFTVASGDSIAGRMLHMRDDAFDALDDDAPNFVVERVDEHPEPEIARTITGTYEVPLYLTDGGEPGSRLTQGPDGLPERVDDDFTASFVCIVPPSVLGADGTVVPGRIAVYGHGLLGSNEQVASSYVRETADELGFVFCGTDWIGMSSEDIPNAVEILHDLGRFPSLPDRAQQGILNTLFLGRLMLHEDGFGSDPAFRGPRDEVVLDTAELYFDGNSQGAIMGGAATAVAQDWTRAVLGVGAMNFSVLLNRSTDFDEYFELLRGAYTDPVERTVGYALLQMLWDRAETNGYALHLTGDPYPNTPEKTVLMQIAFGDHQVANVASDTMARTIGACARRPALAEGRSPDVEPLWGIRPFEETAGDCSAIVYFDSGAPPPPTANIPPRAGEDPHGDPRRDPAAKQQKSDFLRPDGVVVDVCAGEPCSAEPA